LTERQRRWTGIVYIDAHLPFRKWISQTANLGMP
jgi:hypothetical protein